MRVEWGVTRNEFDTVKITDAAGNIVRFTGAGAQWVKDAIASGESCCVFDPPKEEPEAEEPVAAKEKAPAKKAAKKKKKSFLG